MHNCNNSLWKLKEVPQGYDHEGQYSFAAYSARETLDSVYFFYPFITSVADGGLRQGQPAGGWAAANKNIHYNTVVTRLKEFESSKNLHFAAEPEQQVAGGFLKLLADEFDSIVYDCRVKLNSVTFQVGSNRSGQASTAASNIGHSNSLITLSVTTQSGNFKDFRVLCSEQQQHK
jgi:hypothetical protein